MDLARINEDGILEIVNGSAYKKKDISLIRESGFLEFVPSEQPQATEGYTTVDYFEEKDGKLYQSWRIEPDKEAIKVKIEALKQQLSTSDYQIIKCCEASLIGEELPYDINGVHEERQQIRDEINRLEQTL